MNFWFEKVVKMEMVRGCKARQLFHRYLVNIK